MAFRRSITGDKEEPRQFFGLTDYVYDPNPEASVDFDPMKSRLRLSLQFDAIAINALDGTEVSQLAERYFAFIRVQTTRGRLTDPEYIMPAEGEWVQISVGKKEKTPRTWIAPSDHDFIPGRAENTLSLSRVEPGSDLERRLKKTCARPPKAKTLTAAQVIKRLDLKNTENLSIKALDVGQASCVAFSEAG